jgi:hypothetical protein
MKDIELEKALERLSDAEYDAFAAQVVSDRRYRAESLFPLALFFIFYLLYSRAGGWLHTRAELRVARLLGFIK